MSSVNLFDWVVKNHSDNVLDNAKFRFAKVLNFKDAIKYNQVKAFPPSLNDDKIIIYNLHINLSNYCTISYIGGDGLSRVMEFTNNGNIQVEFLNDDDPAVREMNDRLIFDGFKGALNYTGKIGADPEIFVEGESGVIPAYLFLGSKENPDRTDYMAPKEVGSNPMYWDGFQAEFTTTPCNCLEYHTDSVYAGLHAIHTKAKAKFPDAKLSLQSVFDIPFELLQSAADEHVNFGCMPSYNAYGLAVNMPPAREVPFRSAGGHIHFGMGKINDEQAIPFVKTLDKILGVACVALFANQDDPRRRILYGLPGEYRLPPHGLEYRPLSNAWLCHPVIKNLVFDLARKAIMLEFRGFSNHWVAEEKDTLSIIINSDVKAAQASLERNSILFKMLLAQTYCWRTPYGEIDTKLMEKNINRIYDVFYNGLDSLISDPKDFSKNWRFNYVWKTQNAGELTNVVRVMNKTKSGDKI